MSLTQCLKKAGAALDASDRTFILERAAELRRSGLLASKAGQQAVDERLAEVRAMLADLGDKRSKAPKAPSGHARHPATIMGSRLLAAVSMRAGGLDPAWLAEFSARFETGRIGRDGRPIVQWRNPMISGIGTLFRRGGTQDLQQLAELLEAEGYLEPGSVEQDAKAAGERAKDMIRAALNRNEPQTLDEQIAERQAADDADREAYYAELDAESAAEAEAERQAILAEIGMEPEALAEVGDDIVFEGAGSADTAGLMRALGFTEQEIADELANEEGARGAQGRGQEEPGAGPQAAEARGAAAGAEAGEGLTSPTAEGLRAADERARAAEAADRAEQKRLADKAKADSERDEFTLTGSDRPADVAAAAGQGGLFDAPRTEPTSEPKTIADVGEKIGGARKDLAAGSGPRAQRQRDDEPGWRKRYVVSQIIKSGRAGEEGRWTINDKRTTDSLGQPKRVGRDSYATKEEAEAVVPLVEVARNHHAVPTTTKDGQTVYRIMRTVSDRKRVQVVGQDFDTREAALQHMAEHAVEIIETKTSFGEEILPRPDKVRRAGEARRDGDAKGEDFLRDFGLRGVEFGNWNSQDERQEVMNHAYDALADLADVLGLPAKAIGMNGELGLAFGARGHGLTGARAHYEHDYGVINLTKMKGAGSLAHEWFHALDHYFGRQDGKTPSERKANTRGDMVFDSKSAELSMVSHGFGRQSKARPELRSAYDALIKTMQRKAETYVEDAKKAEKFVGDTKADLARKLQALRDSLAKQLDPAYWKRNNAPASAEQLADFDAIAEPLIAGDGLSTAWRAGEAKTARAAITGARWTNNALERLSAIYKAVRGRSGFTADRTGVLDDLRNYMGRYEQRLKMLADAQASSTKQRAVPTDFLMDAKAIDQGRASDYWTTPHEMAARAFQSYVEDKVAERGGRSDFLTYGTNTVIPTPWGWARPFPRGNERIAINKAFDEFVSAIQTREEGGKVAMFSRSAPFVATEQVGGHPTYANAQAGIAIAFPQPTARLEVIEGEGEQVVNYAIMPLEGFDTYGYVELLLRDGKPVSLLDIEINDEARRLGIGRGVIETLLAADPEAELNISNIVPEAQGFWERMGIPVQNVEPGAAYDGTLDWQTYAQAQNAGRTGRAVAAGGRAREGGDARAAREVQGARREGQEGLTAAEAAAVLALPADIRSRLLDGKPSAERIREMALAMAPELDVGVVQSVDEMPAAERGKILASAPEGRVRGVYFRGDDRIWLVADHLHSEAEATFVLLHEAFHRGLAKTLGEDAKRALRRMYHTNGKLQQLTKQQMRAHGIELDEAIEEALADLAGKGEARALRGWARLVAVIRGWLAKAAEALGIDIAWTDEMIEDFVADARSEGLKGGPHVNVAEDVAASRSGGIIEVRQVGPELWAVVRSGNEHLGYHSTEAAANEQAEHERARGARKGGRWWVADNAPGDDRAVPIQWAGGPQLDAVGRARAVESTLAARARAVTTRAEGLRLRQIAENAGDCFALATEASAAGIGDMVLGLATGEAGRVWHAVVTREGMVYDPTFQRWFDPGVYEALGFEPRATVAMDQVRKMLAASRGNMISPYTLGLTDAEGNEPGDRRLSRASPDWIAAGNQALQSAASKIDTYAPRKTIAEKAREMSAGWKAKLVQGMLDAYAPLRELSMDAYIAARMTRSADGAFEGMLMHGKPEMTADGGIRGDLDGKGFLGAMRELKGEHDRFFAWLAGNRAGRLMAEGREHLFTDDEIQALKALDQGKMADGSSRAAAFKKAHQTFNEYTKAVLDMAETAGLFDGESRQAWEHDFYVPFYRMSEDSQISGPAMKVKGLVRQEAFKRLKGGKENLGDLMDNTLRNWSHLISASLANVAASKSLLAAERVGAAIEAKEDTAKDIAKATGLKGHATYFMDQGRQRWFVVEDPAVLQAVSSLEAPALNGLALKIMGRFKKYLTLGVTVSPAFKVRNLIRDTIAAPAANEMSYNVAKNLAQGWKGTDKTTDAYAQMLFGGALMKFGTYLEGDRAEHVKRLIADGVDEGRILNTPQKVKAALGRAWDAWQGFGDRLENVNRTALYQQLIAKGMSPREAAYHARDMMDFSLQGSWAAMRMLTAVVPFLNARAQGLYKLGRAAQEDPRRMAYMVAAVSLASITLMLANQDDEDWKAREDWDRDAFWWIKVGDTAFRIPKPFEVGAMGTIAERSVELLVSDEMTGKRFAERMKQMLLDTFAMNPVPQLFKPMVDLYANKDSFTGRQIETLGMERFSKPERFGPNTSGVARVLGAAGEYTGLSPVQIDHMIRAYFGWLGVQAATVVDVMASPFGEAVKPAARIDDFSGGFIKTLPAAPSRYLEDFYTQAKETAEAMADLKRAREVGDTAKAAGILEARGDKVALYALHQRAQRQIAEVNKRIRMIRDSSTLDAQTKREQLDALAQLRNRLAKAVMDRTRALAEAH